MTYIEIGETDDPEATQYAEMVDLFVMSRALLDRWEWAEPVSVYDVLKVCAFLAIGEVDAG